MDNFKASIFKDRIKYLRHRIVTVGAILLAFIIAFSLILLKEIDKLNKQTKELEKISQTLRYDWQDFENLYETSSSSLEDYITQYSAPYTTSSFLAGLNISRIKDLQPSNDYFNEYDLISLNYAIKHLVSYNNNLRSLLSYVKGNKSFAELNSEQLNVLLQVISFSSTADQNYINLGLMESRKVQKKLIQLHNENIYPVKKSFTVDIYKNFINMDGGFESFDVILMNFKDPRFGNFLNEEKFKNYQTIIEYLTTSKYKNYLEIKSKEQILKGQINTAISRDLVRIPIINFDISLKHFLIFGGLINLGLLLYFYFMLFNLKRLFINLNNSLETKLDIGDKKAIFYGLDYNINNKIVFLFINGAFFSALPILSFILSFILVNKLGAIQLINSNETINIKIIYLNIIVVLVNIFFSIFLSVKQFNLNK